MAELEPAQFQVYGIPVTKSNVVSLEMRQALEALARNFYTTDEANPTDPREGQFRINAFNPANIKLDAYLGGAWQTILQGLGTGIAAPVKQIVQFDTPLQQWVIQHNLGSQPAVQVFDSSFQQLEVVPAVQAVQRVHLGTIPTTVLTTLPVGVTALRLAQPVYLTGSFLSAFAVAQEAVGGAPVGQIEFEIAGQGVMTGGEIVFNTALVGTILNGVAATGNNALTAGGTIEIRANMTTAPTGGALELYANVLPGIQQGQARVTHVNEDRVIIDHAAAIEGFAILVG